MTDVKRINTFVRKSNIKIITRPKSNDTLVKGSFYYGSLSLIVKALLDTKEPNTFHINQTLSSQRKLIFNESLSKVGNMLHSTKNFGDSIKGINQSNLNVESFGNVQLIDGNIDGKKIIPVKVNCPICVSSLKDRISVISGTKVIPVRFELDKGVTKFCGGLAQVIGLKTQQFPSFLTILDLKIWSQLRCYFSCLADYYNCLEEGVPQSTCEIIFNSCYFYCNLFSSWPFLGQDFTKHS